MSYAGCVCVWGGGLEREAQRETNGVRNEDWEKYNEREATVDDQSPSQAETDSLLIRRTGEQVIMEECDPLALSV